MLRICLWRTERLFQKGDAHALGAANITQGCRGPGLALDHLSEQSKSHRDDFAVLGKTDDGLIEEGVLLLGDVTRALWQVPVGGPECSQHLASMAGIEKINSGGVLALDQPDFQGIQEPCRRHPEIVTHQHSRLNMLTIAMTKSVDQFRVLLT